MNIHYFQHVPFEGLGYIQEWAHHQGHRVTGTMLHADGRLPEPSDWDCLVVLGGPMGVHDTDQHAWLAREKRCIETALRSGKPVLGICLGAQLIADVLGARVYRNAHTEIGWYAVNPTRTAGSSDVGALFADPFHAFHWHGDTFDIPTGAVHLASSSACRNQAFFYPPAALGLQFHLESTQASIDALIDQCGAELIEGLFIQDAARIRDQSRRIASSNAHMRRILDFFADRYRTLQKASG